MSGNTYGKLFTVTTAGESHGPALVAIVDGCPPGLEISWTTCSVTWTDASPAPAATPPSARKPMKSKSCPACSKDAPPAAPSPC